MEYQVGRAMVSQGLAPEIREQGKSYLTRSAKSGFGPAQYYQVMLDAKKAGSFTRMSKQIKEKIYGDISKAIQHGGGIEAMQVKHTITNDPAFGLGLEERQEIERKVRKELGLWVHEGGVKIQ